MKHVGELEQYPEVLEQSVEEPRKAITHTTSMKHLGGLEQYPEVFEQSVEEDLLNLMGLKNKIKKFIIKFTFLIGINIKRTFCNLSTLINIHFKLDCLSVST